MITIDFRYVTLSPDTRVLDIGCGTGRHVAAVGDRGDGFVVGADANADDLLEARGRLELHERIGDTRPGAWAFSAADVTRLPFADASFDIVICSEVLEHIHDHRRAMAELARVLEPSGDLIISVPRRWPERLCWALSREYRNTPGGHIRIYRRRRLIRMVRSAGFRLRHSHHAHSLHVPYWWLKCLLGVNRDDHWPVRVYHRFLTWEMMRQPALIRSVERLLNPILGKSAVLYFRHCPDEAN
jgi:ubiquinone/menaquinone biosynthesis C-methylase UbiE